MSGNITEERPGMLARLADLLFGGAFFVSDPTPSVRIAVTMISDTGEARVEIISTEEGRPANEQMDEIFARLHHAVPVDNLRIAAISYASGADDRRRWVVACRGRRSDVVEIPTLASCAEEAALCARFAIAARGRPIELDDVATLHEVGETIATIEVIGAREEPASYEEFRGLVAGLARDLRDGKTVEETTLSEIERVLVQFPKAA